MSLPAKPKALLFDLDGTLVHSAPDIMYALNIVMAHNGLKTFDLAQVMGMIGGGVPLLIARALKANGETRDGAETDALIIHFIETYEPASTNRTELMPGAMDALRFGKDNGLHLGVVTNKPHAATMRILDHFDVSKLLDVVIGGDSGPEKKPAPGPLLMACEKLGVGVSEAVMIGDSPADAGAAKAAGMAFVAVRGGYTPVPADELGGDVVVDGLGDVRRVVLG